MAKTQAVVTDLIGAVAKPTRFDYKLVDGEQVTDTDKPIGDWPDDFAPMVPGRHVATVHAVYLDDEGALKLYLVDPHGHTGEVFATNVIIEPKRI